MTSPLQQKIKIAGPSVVTANRAWDGAVIYRTASKGWTTDLSDAAVVSAAGEARVRAGVPLHGRAGVVAALGVDHRHHELRVDPALLHELAVHVERLDVAVVADRLERDVSANIAPVEIRDGGKIEPGNLREQFRSLGVTIDLPVPV